MTRVAVLGAGSIGCWVGGMLAAAGGADVTLIGRDRLKAALSDGFAVSSLSGDERKIAPSSFRFETRPETLSEASVILVCVKGPDTKEAARQIARHASPSSTVVSLQNGIGPFETLRDDLNAMAVVPGVVVFNVTRPQKNHFHRSTEGTIIVPPNGAQIFADSAIPVHVSDNIEGARWSKLMLNLNNGPNALSGLPLREHLLDRDWRKVFALAIAEGLSVAANLGITVERIGRVHPHLARRVLPLPNVLFTRIAKAMMRIDPSARTSMADDLDAGRSPEIDILNGAVCRYGTEAGVSTPANDAIVRAVRDAFAAGQSPRLTGREFRSRYGV